MTNKDLETEVFDLADELQKSGQTISVRIILAKVEGKGSLATVGRYLKMWREKKLKEAEQDIRLTSILIKAAREEVALHVKEKTERLEKALERSESTNEELLQSCKKFEDIIEKQKKEIEDLLKSRTEKDFKISFFSDERKRLNGLIEEANREKEEISKNVIIADTNHKNLLSQIDALEVKYKEAFERAIRAEEAFKNLKESKS